MYVSKQLFQRNIKINSSKNKINTVAKADNKELESDIDLEDKPKIKKGDKKSW